jgi:hypothetical protein
MLSKQKGCADASMLYCYWAVEELGYSLADLSGQLTISPSGVGCAACKGMQLAEKSGYRLPG